MSQFNVKPGRGRRAIAASIAAIAVFDAISGPLSSRFMAGAILLFAYELAFIPSPPFNVRLSEVYAQARQGWRMTWASKILGATGFVLFITSIYLQWQGR